MSSLALFSQHLRLAQGRISKRWSDDRTTEGYTVRTDSPLSTVWELTTFEIETNIEESMFW